MDNPVARDHDESDAKKKPDKAGGTPGSERDPSVPAPFAPDPEEDSPLGDTDEHSDA